MNIEQATPIEETFALALAAGISQSHLDRNTEGAGMPGKKRSWAIARRSDTRKLLGDIRSLIESSRRQVARAVNTGLVQLYWGVGRRIHKGILKEERARYGEQILPTLSAKLVPQYGQGFSARNI